MPLTLNLLTSAHKLEVCSAFSQIPSATDLGIKTPLFSVECTKSLRYCSFTFEIKFLCSSVTFLPAISFNHAERYSGVSVLLPIHTSHVYFFLSEILTNDIANSFSFRHALNDILFIFNLTLFRFNFI